MRRRTSFLKVSHHSSISGRCCFFASCAKGVHSACATRITLSKAKKKSLRFGSRTEIRAPCFFQRRLLPAIPADSRVDICCPTVTGDDLLVRMRRRRNERSVCQSKPLFMIRCPRGQSRGLGLYTARHEARSECGACPFFTHAITTFNWRLLQS